MSDSNVKQNSKLKNFARSLRSNMTEEERRLWYTFLSGYPVRFMRQKIIGGYIVDFYCSKAKLVIEIDGSQHYDNSGMLYDETRTDFLQKQGLKVIRFTNIDINTNFKGVCEYIENIVTKRVKHIAGK